MIDYIWRVNDLDVYYTNETNGGGDYFAIEYIDVVREWYGTVDHTLEWCSGPGFIGYGMLASNLCNNVSFVEMHNPAILMLERTKQYSKYVDNINIYEGNTLECVPNNQQFNLVVGNPPHWKDVESAASSLGLDIMHHAHILEILVDDNWNAHRDFFKRIKLLLSNNGSVLLQENYAGSSPEDFRQMVDDAGLKINFTADSRMYADKGIYYISVGHK